MLLDIITGGIGSGKSSYLFNLINENLKNNPDANAVLIVPEQFSYTAEKTLCAISGGLGPNRIEVLTFSRLVHRFVNQENIILPSGKMMLISKVASAVGEDNVFFSGTKKGGFISSLQELFSELRRYEISPADLDTLSFSNEATAKKIASVNEIYTNYLNLFGEDFSDSEDALSMFADFASGSAAFHNTFFFIDDYNDFMPQHLRVIRSLIRSSRGVFITLGMDPNSNDELFAPVKKAKNQLTAIALDEGAQLYTKELYNSPDYIKSDDIRHLLTHWEDKQKFSGKCENISLFSSRDLYSEIEHAASEIIKLVRDFGYRFRDIGLILGDMSGYLHILNAVFKDYNIPFFTDEKTSVAMHPISRTVLALFNILDENWSYSSVFDYLRAGYIYIKDETGISPLSQEDVDLLENYVLMRGIRGKKSWFSEWTEVSETIFDDVIENRHSCETDLEKLNRLREQIILPFSKFLENKGRTVRKIATAVYEFLCDINLYEGIISECKQLDSENLRDESEQFRQVWNNIIEVLDQMVTTLGDETVSRETFSQYFKNGLLECSLSIIPSGLDRVSVGTISRNSPTRVRALFIIGTTHGLIPCEPSSSAILSPLDRALINAELSSFEKELAPDDVKRILLENLKLFRCISTATEKLYVSYPASNSEGNSLSPAQFVSELINMFPDMKKLDNIISKPTDEDLLASSKRGFYYMLTKLSEYYKETPEALWQSVFDWYSKNPEYKNRLETLKIAAKYKKIQPQLSRLKAQLLYGKNKKYSITALEKYTKCPFAYYLERGLYVEPQEMKRVEKSHIGSLIHACVCEFCKAVEDGAETLSEMHERWTSLTESKCNALISDIMKKMSEKILSNTKEDKKQIEYLLSRCERTLKKSVDTIRLSLSKGGYTAICYEKDFEIDINWDNERVTLLGTIDRIDIMEHLANRKANLRIVDYKSGHKKFSISAICNKLDMQLVLYSVAAVNLYSSGKLGKVENNLSPQVSAIMYNKINDDIVTVDSPDKSLAAQKLKKQKKLDGIVVLDKTEEGDLIYDAAFDMDDSLSESGESAFLDISFKKDGTLYAASQVTSRETFDLLTEYMKKTVIDTDTAIKSGNISITPYRDGQSSPCNWCDYHEICMSDGTNCRKLFGNDEKALEFIKKELENNE